MRLFAAKDQFKVYSKILLIPARDRKFSSDRCLPMTTAAIADGVVAVDSQLTGGNYSVRCQKIIRLPDGGVAVASGLWRMGYAGLKWLADGEKGEPPDIEGATIAIVRPDHSIWIAEDGFPAFPILDRTYALGCGQDLARKAMADGADPIQAVAEACELDAVSSAPILSLTVEPVEFSDVAVHTVKRAKARK